MLLQVGKKRTFRETGLTTNGLNDSELSSPLKKKLKILDSDRETLNKDCNLGDQLREQIVLKEKFVDDIVPLDIPAFCVRIGIPSELLEKINYEHPRDTATVIQVAFDKWFQVAKSIGLQDGMSPRFLLARAFFKQNNINVFNKLLDNVFLRTLVELDCEIFDILVDKIYAVLCELKLTVN